MTAKRMMKDRLALTPQVVYTPSSPSAANTSEVCCRVVWSSGVHENSPVQAGTGCLQSSSRTATLD